jgi:hypothetical protein
MTRITQVELRSKIDEDLTQSAVVTNTTFRAKLRRERFEALWYGVVGRRFRYAILLVAIFLLIFTVLMGIENHIK